MTKNDRNNEKAKPLNCRIIAVYVFAAVLAALIIVLIVMGIGGESSKPDPTTTPTQNNLNVQVQPVQKETIDLGNDLGLLSVGKFAGIYLEDGSNEVVSNIMMVQVVNNSPKDLQFAKFKLQYAKFTAEFEASNIPAGKTVVLLEKNRQKYVDEKYTSASVENVVYFQKNMNTAKDQFEISGLKGALNIKNISGADISGDIYVYYKYTSADQLYGGITFRAKVQGGLKSGELRQVMTSHFNPDTCVIVAVEQGA